MPTSMSYLNPGYDWDDLSRYWTWSFTSQVQLGDKGFDWWMFRYNMIWIVIYSTFYVGESVCECMGTDTIT